MFGKSDSEDSFLVDVFKNELKDIYWAEKKLVETLPKMAKEAKQPDLVAGINSHLDETKKHVERLERIFGLLKMKPEGKKCMGIDGIVKEGEQAISDFKDSGALDAVIIGAAQKVEHYEIATYGTLRTYASQLGMDDVVMLLQKTLDEEGAADKKLTEIAEKFVNERAEHKQEEMEPPK